MSFNVNNFNDVNNKHKDKTKKTKLNNGDLLICYSNVNSLLNKRYELQNLIADKDPDIIQLTETLPKNCKKDDFSQDFHIPGYNLFFNNNPKRGITVYIKTSIDASLIEIINCDLIECICLSLKINNQCIFLGCTYRSPSNDKCNSTTQIINLFKSFDICKYDKFLMTGDFNYPDIDWSDKLLLSSIDCKFVDCIDDLFLQQMVTQPTRNMNNQKCNILDLLFTNDDTLVKDIEHIAPLGSSDHDVLLIYINIPRIEPAQSEPRLNFYKTDLKGLKKHILDTDWSCLHNSDIDQAWNHFSCTLHKGFKLFVPKSKVKSKKQPFWLNKNCSKLIKKKYHFFKRFKASKLSDDYHKYAEARNKVKKEIRLAVKEHEKKISSECKKNVKPFWKYVNSKLKRTTGIPNLLKPDKTLTTSDEEKANVLNDFFSSVFTKEDLSDIPIVNNRSNNIFLSNLIIKEDDIKQKLNGLNTAKAMGPDGIPSIILKELRNEISLPLSIIFNKSLTLGTVPKVWKEAEVTAIFKKGNKTEPGNYRPVSLTSISCKLLEAFVTNHIRIFMETNKLFSDCQHGFRNHRSCVTQLLEVMNDLSRMIEEGDSIDIIYLDFSKAFDTVPHQRLLAKLNAYGIDGNILKWIESFLSDRSQRVRVNKEHSNYSPVSSGIPQGSILGPLLFIVFINDLPENISSTCKVFADDTKLYSSHNNHISIQKDLLTFLEWSEKWLLKFNKSKCSVLHMGNKNKQNKYFMDSESTEELKTTINEKDVGVTFSTNLKFNTHINNVIKKGNQMTGLIRRSFVHLDKNMLITLYKSLIRPHLEYANVIWHPMYKVQLVALEKVQRRATKLLPDIRNMSYKERLVELKLPSIKFRQIRGDLIQTYKIIHNIDNINCSDFFSFYNYNSTRGSSTKFQLFPETAQSNSRKNFLPCRINTYWNSLVETTRTAKHMIDFKKGVDSNLSEIMYDYDE